MLGFIKKLLGYPTEAEKAAAKAVSEAPYKLEKPEFVAVGEPPATVVIPVEDTSTAKAEAPVKKPRAKKTAVEKKSPAKKAPKAKKPKTEKK